MILHLGNWNFWKTCCKLVVTISFPDHFVSVKFHAAASRTFFVEYQRDKMPWGRGWRLYFITKMKNLEIAQYAKNKFSFHRKVPNIGQCPAKNRVLSNKGCFATDTFVGREAWIVFISYRSFKTLKHLVSIGHHCFGFLWIF